MQIAHFKLQLGAWKFIIGACSPDVEALLGEVSNDFLLPFNGDNWSDSEINESYLGVCTPKILDQPELPGWLPESEHSAWYSFLASLKSVSHQIKRGDPSGSPVYSWPKLEFSDADQNDKLLRHSTSTEGSDRFFAFVIDQPDEHNQIELILHILSLASKWHVEHGGLCLHASAVADGEQGFLFLGPSEAGKTTISGLSSLIGHSSLGDDVNFIIKDGENSYKLAAGPTLSGSTLEHSLQRPILRGIFSLIQEEQDYLVPLPPMQVARLLAESLGQVPFYYDFSEKNVGKAFQTCCAIARKVPGYELHFRKSSDFWNVINEQFPK